MIPVLKSEKINEVEGTGPKLSMVKLKPGIPCHAGNV